MIRLTERSIQAVYSGFEIYWNFVSQILRQGVFNDIKKEFLKTLYEAFESILKFSINDLDCIIQKDSKSSQSTSLLDLTTSLMCIFLIVIRKLKLYT